MTELVVTTGTIGRAKLQSNHHHQQNNTQFFTGRMPFLSPNQQCQSTEGKISHSMDLLTPNSPGGHATLSLTTNRSWLPWGKFAMPLISPLMPVPLKVTKNKQFITIKKLSPKIQTAKYKQNQNRFHLPNVTTAKKQIGIIHTKLRELCITVDRVADSQLRSQVQCSVHSLETHDTISICSDSLIKC